MTDMEEKKMIEQAKAGDPKAQFEMSQWARQMSILEPDEERWNRLAAKCLVDAAQAGYGPAKDMVQRLVSGQGEEPEAPETPMPTVADTARFAPVGKPSAFFDDFETPAQPAAPERSFYDQAGEADYDAPEEEEYDLLPEESGFMAVVKKAAAAAKKGVMFAAAAAAGLIATLREKKKDAADEPGEAEVEAAPAGRRSAAHSRASGFSAWVDENWQVLRIVCIVVCVVLAALIVVLLIPSEEAEVEELPELAPTVEPTAAPTPEPFPNEATKLEISTTGTLQYRPGDSDASSYLTASQSFTVQAEASTDTAENLRQGPSASDYPDVIMRIDNGTKVTAYAKYQNSEGVVWYLINCGGTWGWMYGKSLS